MKTALPESLRRILAAQAPRPAPATPTPFRRLIDAQREARTETTTIWRDGEAWRQDARGRLRQLKSISPLA